MSFHCLQSKQSQSLNTASLILKNNWSSQTKASLATTGYSLSTIVRFSTNFWYFFFVSFLHLSIHSSFLYLIKTQKFSILKSFERSTNLKQVFDQHLMSVHLSNLFQSKRHESSLVYVQINIEVLLVNSVQYCRTYWQRLLSMEKLSSYIK